MSIPFWFGFVLVSKVNYVGMEITVPVRFLAGIFCEVLAVVSTALIVYGGILTFDIMISEKMHKFYGERRVDPGR